MIAVNEVSKVNDKTDKNNKIDKESSATGVGGGSPHGFLL